MKYLLITQSESGGKQDYPGNETRNGVWIILEIKGSFPCGLLTYIYYVDIDRYRTNKVYIGISNFYELYTFNTSYSIANQYL